MRPCEWPRGDRFGARFLKLRMPIALKTMEARIRTA
jgi:hypothetical protein